MTHETVWFWWAVKAFASALAGAVLFAGLVLWNMEGALWEGMLWAGGVLSTIGALAGGCAGWRLFGGKGKGGRVQRR